MCASKIAKRYTFEILNPKPQNVLKSYFKMRNSKTVLQNCKKCTFEILNPKPYNVLKSEFKMRNSKKKFQKVVVSTFFENLNPKP